MKQLPQVDVQTEGPGCDCCDHEIEVVATGTQRLMDVGPIRVALLAGVLLAAGFILKRIEVAYWWATTAGALLVGGWTFIPEALRRAVKLRIGVDTLMTIAAAAPLSLEISKRRRLWLSSSRSLKVWRVTRPAKLGAA